MTAVCSDAVRWPTSIHVHLQAFLLDDGGELRCLRLDQIGKLLRRAVIGPCARRGDLALGSLALEENFDFLFEGLDAGPGRVLRQEKPEPGRASDICRSRPALRPVR